jgi:hypothetical protein
MKIKISSFGIHIFFFYLLIFSFSTSENVLAQKNTKQKTYHWEVQLSLGTMYDNNILKYSDKYIERFLNSKDEGRFHISSYDDLVFPHSVDIIYSNQIIGDQVTVFTAGYNSNAYSYNGIKTWGRYYINWRQYVVKSTSFLVSYSYIPNFYIRHFRDDDWVDRLGYTPETYQPYEFSKDEFSAWVQHSFFWKTTRARLYFSYMRYFHNEHYTEYDSDNYLYGFRVYQTLSKSIRVNAGYKYITSDAKGIDLVNDTDEAALASRGDATYEEHIYSVGAGFKFPKVFGLKNDISITGQYQERFYKTDHFLELDPLHAGRFDKNIRIYSRYNLYLFSYLSLTAFFNWIYRDTETSADLNREYVSNEKDYSQYQLGIRINYKIKF